MLRQAQIAKYLKPALRGFVSGLAEKNGTSSCSTSPGTRWRCKKFRAEKMPPGRDQP